MVLWNVNTKDMSFISLQMADIFLWTHILKASPPPQNAPSNYGIKALQVRAFLVKYF